MKTPLLCSFLFFLFSATSTLLAQGAPDFPDQLEKHEDIHDPWRFKVWCPKTGKFLESAPKQIDVVRETLFRAKYSWPKEGEIIEPTIHIKIVPDPQAENIELIYELKSSSGLWIMERPELPDHLFSKETEIRIKVPVEVLSARKPQRLRLIIAAYSNGKLVDWANSELIFCRPAPEILKRAVLNAVSSDDEFFKNGKKIWISDEQTVESRTGKR